MDLALFELGASVCEEPGPPVAACEASNLSLALEEAAKLSVEKPLGS